MYHHHNYANAPPITHHISTPQHAIPLQGGHRCERARECPSSLWLRELILQTIAPTPSHIQSENYMNASSLRALLQAACNDDTLPSGESRARIKRHGIGDFFGLTQAL